MSSLAKSIASRLSRKTSSNYFLPEVDGFRFYAIFTVLLYHLNTHLSRSVNSLVDQDYFESSYTYAAMLQGGIGVNVFFAISGFILALPFARQRLQLASPVNLKGYYLRRLTRLEPPYLISLILLLIVHLLFLKESIIEIFPNFLASVFYVHNIVYDQWSKINPVAWSLEVEVQFYIIAPFLAALFSISNTTLRRLTMVLLIIGGMVHYNLNYEMIETLHLRKSIFMHLHQFLVGFLFADIFLSDWNEKPGKKSFWYDILGVGVMTSLLIFNEPFYFMEDLIFGVCLFLSFICLFRGKLINRFFTSRWIVVIGGMCYSIYLLHYALIAFLTSFSAHLFSKDMGYGANFAIQFILVIPVVLIVSAVYFVLIERPCMDKTWPSRFLVWIKGSGV
ncbi:MAG: acyltransferase [Cytophagales bacterium]|nr:acyltransferase [Cytophagales bacterium]